MDKNTFYNPSWEDASQYPEYASWITRGSDSKHFKCKVCPTGVSLKLSNMGTEALKSHITGNKKKKGDSKHETNMNKYLKLLQGQKKIGFTSPSSVLSPVTSPTFASTSHTSLPETPSSTALASTSSDSLVEHSNNPKKQMTFRTSGTKDKAKAEILLAMKAVVSHIPQRTLDDFNKLAMKMFPDSQIAKDMESGRTKLGYNINYGLAPYYKDKLLKTLQGGESVAPKFTACFDESYNTVTHSKQFDVHVIYFDEITKRVRRKYLTSQFIGHGDANSLLDHFNKVLDNKLDAKNLIQISMDGPNVNWKMLELVTEERKKDPLCPELLLLGSCGLHILHGGYQTAQECTEMECTLI